jgi:hypothetical protein
MTVFTCDLLVCHCFFIFKTLDISVKNSGSITRSKISTQALYASYELSPFSTVLYKLSPFSRKTSHKTVIKHVKSFWICIFFYNLIMICCKMHANSSFFLGRSENIFRYKFFKFWSNINHECA